MEKVCEGVDWIYLTLQRVQRKLLKAQATCPVHIGCYQAEKQ
jgi:hypothetical protein